MIKTQHNKKDDGGRVRFVVSWVAPSGGMHRWINGWRGRMDGRMEGMHGGGQARGRRGVGEGALPPS